MKKIDVSNKTLKIIFHITSSTVPLFFFFLKEKPKLNPKHVLTKIWKSHLHLFSLSQPLSSVTTNQTHLKLCGYLLINVCLCWYLSPTGFLHLDMSCSETKGPRFQFDISWWRLSMVLSFLRRVISLFGFGSLILSTKQVLGRLLAFWSSFEWMSWMGQMGIFVGLWKDEKNAWIALWWVWIRIHLDTAYFVENWKYCSKIIFKCVHNTVGPIFSENIVEKEVCGSREQYTGLIGAT